MPIVPPRKRKRPTTAGQRESNVQAYSVREFFAEFPNDDACLMRVMEVRYGMRHVCRKCGKDSTFHKLTNRKAFACSHCGDEPVSVRGHHLSGQSHAAANVVLCDLPIHCHATRR